MQRSLEELIHQALSNNEVVAVLLAALLSGAGWFLTRAIVGWSRVAWAFSHQHAFYLQNLNPPVLAYTKEIWVQNVGRAIAEDVEIVLGSKPQHYDLWPQRHYTELVNPDGSMAIKIDNLNRREHVTVSIFQTAIEPPLVTNVRWHGGVGKKVPMGPRQLLPKWVNVLAASLMMFGLFSIIYFLLKAAL